MENKATAVSEEQLEKEATEIKKGDWFITEGCPTPQQCLWADETTIYSEGINDDIYNPKEKCTKVVWIKAEDIAGRRQSDRQIAEDAIDYMSVNAEPHLEDTGAELAFSNVWDKAKAEYLSRFDSGQPDSKEK